MKRVAMLLSRAALDVDKKAKFLRTGYLGSGLALEFVPYPQHVM
jgi:hypothetical protein